MPRRHPEQRAPGCCRCRAGLRPPPPTRPWLGGGRLALASVLVVSLLAWQPRPRRRRRLRMEVREEARPRAITNGTPQGFPKPSARIPRIIHQTWKTVKLPPRFQQNIRTWKRICSDYEHRFYNDSQVYDFFQKHFPSKHKLMRKLKNGAVLADLFRYAVLYVEGGVYVDIDTEPLRRFPDHFHKKDLVVGLEFDPVHYPHECLQYCQWCIMVRPKHPAMLAAFLRGVENILTYGEDSDVISATGPAMWTRELNGWKAMFPKYNFSDSGNQHTNDPEAGGIAFLPCEVFCAGSGMCVPVTNRTILKHQFAGTWRRR